MITGFTESDIPSQHGRTIFITGANTGIGFEAARALAARGGRVLLGCRSQQRGTQAMERIRAQHPSADLVLVPLDLADLDSVAAAAAVVNQQPKLDVLINNAGIMWTPKMKTQDGFEAQFGINHLGHFALTGHLMSQLLSTPHARVVNIASLGHRLGNGDLFWSDINADKHYNPRTRYFASKLANLLFTYEMHRRLEARGTTLLSVAAHPGGAATELDRNVYGVTKLLAALVRPLVPLVVNTAAQGAWPTALAATADGVKGGQYFGPGGRGELSGPARQVDVSAESKDPEKGRQLWNLSIKMTGVDPGI